MMNLRRTGSKTYFSLLICDDVSGFPTELIQINYNYQLFHKNSCVSKAKVKQFNVPRQSIHFSSKTRNSLSLL